MVSGESRKDLHERWLLRHGLPDAVSQWHDAPADRAPTLAFIAVASDSRILSKLRHDMAETLAEQAERLARDMVAAEGTIDVTRAAAEEVTLRVAVWRHALATGWRPASRSDAAGRRMGLLPAEPDPATTERELFQRALRRHPEFIEPIARRLAVVTWQLGADGLIELGPPFDGVLALSAARIAAGVARGPASASLRPAERLALLGIVEDWAERTGLNPCIVPLQGGAAAIVAQAAGLATDSVHCAAAAAARQDRPSCQAMWETAEEYNAYLVLSLQPRSLTEMVFERAERFASAAARLAEAALADPAVRLPALPAGIEAGGPRLVLATARGVLRNGILPRRSGGGSRCGVNEPGAPRS